MDKPKQTTDKEWYKKPWGVVAAVLLFPFFIIWYAWAKSNWSKNVKIVATVACGIFIIGASASSNSTSSQQASSKQPSPQPQQTQQAPVKQAQPPTPQPKAKYDGKILSYTAINPSSLRFVAQVNNIGDGEGKFNCTVRGKDASSTYTGFDYFEDQGGTLKPGESRTFNGVITIRKEGADYVTDVTIACR